MKRRQRGFIETSDSLSNFDHIIPDGLEATLRSGPYYAYYDARDFNGQVWFAEEGFYCEVWQLHIHVATTVGPYPDLHRLMRDTSDKFGYE